MLSRSDDPFVTHRSRPFTVAYEMLGTAADAEDVVPMDFEISSDLTLLDRALVHSWLKDTYWAMGRSRLTQDAAIDRSLNFGAYDSRGSQVGYARVVTDYATFAWLCDVYVSPRARGHGVGTALVTTVRDHLAPYRLKRILLATADAHGVYAQVGFAPLDDPSHWMELAQL